MAPIYAASVSSGNLLEMQILRPCPRLSELETLRTGPSPLCFHKPSRWLSWECLSGPQLENSGIHDKSLAQELKSLMFGFYLPTNCHLDWVTISSHSNHLNYKRDIISSLPNRVVLKISIRKPLKFLRSRFTQHILPNGVITTFIFFLIKLL